METLETSGDGGGSVVVVGELKTGIGGDCDSVTRDFECGGDGDGGGAGHPPFDGRMTV